MKNQVIAVLFAFFAAAAASAQTPPRTIAVTIDDLPVVTTRTDLAARRAITKKLLAHIRRAKVPAIGFVNEVKLYANGARVEAEVDLLRAWLDAGLELGNHTYSHVNIADVPLEKYEDEIVRGELVTKELMAAKGRRIRYFRHPYLWTGLSLETKSALGAFLAGRGYEIAPVTIDNSDWVFARAYDKALAANDKKLLKELGAAYVPYLEAKLDYWERQSNKLFGREIAQVLLLHANSINAEYLDDIFGALRRRGYRFVPLETALRDEAYRLPDRFVKRNGISWLHRWALDRGPGNVLPDEPRTPDFVLKAAGVESE